MSESKNFDLVKMDIEGSEGDVLNSLSPEHFDRTDFILEVGSLKNSAAIWKLSKQYELRIFSQKSEDNPYGATSLAAMVGVLVKSNSKKIQPTNP